MSYIIVMNKYNLPAEQFFTKRTFAGICKIIKY